MLPFSIPFAEHQHGFTILYTTWLYALLPFVIPMEKLSCLALSKNNATLDENSPAASSLQGIFFSIPRMVR